MWNDAVITNAGRELLSRWTTGETLEITRAATGQGTANAVHLMAQTSLVSEKQTMSIVEKGERVANGVRIRLQITSKGVQTAYTINQIGIWARVGSEAEVLVAIYQDATGVRAPSESEMADYIFTFYATIQTTNDGEIAFTVDPLAAVTNDRFQTEIEKLEQADKDEKKAREDAEKTFGEKIEDLKKMAPIVGTGLKIGEDGKTINHKNALEAGTASGTSGSVSFGGTIKIPTITYDDTGHVTEAGFTEVTLPASPSFEAPVTSVNEKTGDITLGKKDIGLENVDNVRQYSANNPPPYPVTSVNGQTGKVELSIQEKSLPGTGLKIGEDGKTIDHKNSVEAGRASGTSGEVSFGGKISIPTIDYDDTGHITGTGTTEVTLPEEASYSAPVTSVNGKTGDVTLGKKDVGLENVDNVRQYSANNPPPYPVTSVNGQTGKVSIQSVPEPSRSDDGKILGVVGSSYALVDRVAVNTYSNSAGGITMEITT